MRHSLDPSPSAREIVAVTSKQFSSPANEILFHCKTSSLPAVVVLSLAVFILNFDKIRGWFCGKMLTHKALGGLFSCFCTHVIYLIFLFFA